jgi:phage gp45-like
MTQLGTVTGQEIKTNRNGEIDVRLLQVQFSNDRDIQTVQHFNPSGEDSAPIKGDKVIVFDIGPAFKVAVATQDLLAAVMGAGEKKLYSRDSDGVIKAFINLLADGNIELNGNDYASTRFEELETAFNQLKTDFDTHNHPTAPVGPVSTPSTAPSSADISPAESDTVRIP